MLESARIRRTCLFSGQVQGVGFRVTAVGLARGLDVAGYVRNLPDGRVELVVEGLPEELQLLEDRIATSFAGYIREIRRMDSSATGGFTGLQIRR